jgi:hypothetical protein
LLKLQKQMNDELDLLEAFPKFRPS